MKEYYLKDGNRVRGPFLLDDLKYKKIRSNTLVKIDNEGDWIPISEESDLSFLVKVQSNYNITEHNERPVTNKAGSVDRSKRIILLAVIMVIMGLGMAIFFLGKSGDF